MDQTRVCARARIFYFHITRDGTVFVLVSRKCSRHALRFIFFNSYCFSVGFCIVIIIITRFWLERGNLRVSLAPRQTHDDDGACIIYITYIGTIIINICPGDAAAHGHDRRLESRRVNITTARASGIE